MRREVPVRVAVAALAASVGLTSLTWYEPPFAPGVSIVAAAVLAAGTSVLMARRSGFLAVAVSTVALVAYGSALALLWPVGQTASGRIAGFLVHGVRQTLTSNLPLPEDVGTLGPPVITTWVVALFSSELLGRSRAVVGALLPPVAGLIWLWLLGFGQQTSPAGAFLVIGCAGAVVLTRTSELRATERSSPAPLPEAISDAAGPGRARWVRAAAMLVAVAVAGPLLSRITPGSGTRPPVLLRDRVTPPPERSDEPNPLGGITALNTGHRQDELLLRVDSSPRVNQLRMVTLTAYDGRLWGTSGGLRETGRRPAMPPGITSWSTSRQSIAIEGLETDFLISAGWPAEFTPRDPPDARLRVDPLTGNAEVHARGQRVRSYEVVSAVPELAPEQFRAARVSSDPSVDVNRLVPDNVEPDVAALARQVGGSGYTPFDQAVRLENYLKISGGYTIVPTLPPGHTMQHLSSFLRTRQAASSEQFAAAYALAGRILGLPTRVVAGFRVPLNTNEILGRDAYAWPEVHFEGIGWVPFDPTPSAQGSAPPPEPEGSHNPEESLEEAKKQQLQVGHDQPPPPPRELTPSPQEPFQPLVWLGLPAGAGVAAFFGYVVVVALIRSRRRSQRRAAGNPGLAIVGAYHDALDTIDRASTIETSTKAPRELAGVVEGNYGSPAGSQMTDVAVRADEAMFSDLETDRASADAAWEAARELRKAVRRSTPLLNRIGRWLKPATHRRLAEPGSPAGRSGRPGRDPDHDLP